MFSSIYKKEPLKIEDNIPFFSKSDEYTDNYEKISSDHLKIMEKDNHNPFMDEELWNEMEDSTISLIKEFSKKGDKILDVGVGLGRLLSKVDLEDKYGMDISTGYLKVSSKKGINVCYSLIEDIPYKENMFDIVTCTDVLEHVLDLNNCVKNILSVLKPGGYFILRVPYKEDLEVYVNEPNYKFIHLRSFDEHSLRIFFEKIISCKFIKQSKIGYLVTNHRVKCQVPYIRDVIYRNLLRLKKRNITQNMYKKYSKIFLHEVEINFVVQKI